MLDDAYVVVLTELVADDQYAMLWWSIEPTCWTRLPPGTRKSINRPSMVVDLDSLSFVKSAENSAENSLKKSIIIPKANQSRWSEFTVKISMWFPIQIIIWKIKTYPINRSGSMHEKVNGRHDHRWSNDARRNNRNKFYAQQCGYAKYDCTTTNGNTNLS